MIINGKITEIIIFSDSALVTTILGKPARQSPRDWQWIPGRLERLKQLTSQVHLAVCINEEGVAFGRFREIDILLEFSRMCAEVPIGSKGLYTCFTHPEATIEEYREANPYDRMPNPGMLFRAMAAFQFPINPQRVLMVGGLPEEEQAAKRAGCRFMWADGFFQLEGRLQA